jgi:hypothetical protein
MLFIVTTALMLLYRFRCYVLIYGWLLLSVGSLLFLFGGYVGIGLLTAYNVTPGTQALFLFHWGIGAFAVAGAVLVFWADLGCARRVGDLPLLRQVRPISIEDTSPLPLRSPLARFPECDTLTSPSPPKASRVFENRARIRQDPVKIHRKIGGENPRIGQNDTFHGHSWRGGSEQPTFHRFLPYRPFLSPTPPFPPSPSPLPPRLVLTAPRHCPHPFVLGPAPPLSVSGPAPPLLPSQACLVLISALIAWSATKLPEWTTWGLLGAVAIWDLVAVLTPHGPLKVSRILPREGLPM